jgi:Vesicle coat complex COPII, subunit SEC24/subunit SFB2/subunit SFB3
LIPYWQKKRIGGSGTEEDDCWELSVTLMTDVEDEPFSPLPLSMWTFSLLEDCKVVPQTMQQRIHSNEIPSSKLYETLKRIPAILCQMIPDYQCRSSMTPPFSAERGECNSWNCGGAALKILSDALYSCGGGRGTLMTSSLFNHGVGALYDRQGSTNTKYVNESTEKSLFVPHQKVASHSESGAFYSRLAEKCVEGGVSLNIMISSPLGPEVDSGIFENQYLDLATMGEICRYTCGKLRWLKYEDCDFQLDFSIAVEREGCYAHRLKNELL